MAINSLKSIQDTKGYSFQ